MHKWATVIRKDVLITKYINKSPCWLSELTGTVFFSDLQVYDFEHRIRGILKCWNVEPPPLSSILSNSFRRLQLTFEADTWNITAMLFLRFLHRASGLNSRW